MFYSLHPYCIFYHRASHKNPLQKLLLCAVGSALEKMRDNDPRWQILTILFSAVVQTSDAIVMKTIKIPQLHGIDHNLF